jgi:hypothetical protein
MQLVEARQEQIHLGQHRLEERGPVHAPRLRSGIHRAQIQGARQPALSGGSEDGAQFRPAVREHAAHDRRIPEMQETRALEALRVDVLGAERVVGAGAVQEAPVLPRGLRTME